MSGKRLHSELAQIITIELCYPHSALKFAQRGFDPGLKFFLNDLDGTQIGRAGLKRTFHSDGFARAKGSPAEVPPQIVEEVIKCRLREHRPAPLFP